METTILSEFTTYLLLLNWTYMITFVILAWAFSRNNALESWWGEEKSVKIRAILLWIPKGSRVVVLGFVYGIIHYFLFSHEPGDIGKLFLSFIFSVAFHGLILKGIQKKLGI